MNKVTFHTVWKKYFTLIYWRLQLPFFFFNGRPLNIVKTATLEIDDDSELGKLLKDD